jgi:hypothetical protein
MKPRDRWLWLKIIVGGIGGLVLVTGLVGSYNSPSLQVQMDRSGTVVVTNTGSKPIAIQAATINNRDDCRAGGGIMPGRGPFHSQTLKVGEQTYVNSFCNIVRLALETDQGSATYSFSR